MFMNKTTFLSALHINQTNYYAHKDINSKLETCFREMATTITLNMYNVCFKYSSQNHPVRLDSVCVCIFYNTFFQIGNLSRDLVG